MKTPKDRLFQLLDIRNLLLNVLRNNKETKIINSDVFRNKEGGTRGEYCGTTHVVKYKRVKYTIWVIDDKLFRKEVKND